MLHTPQRKHAQSVCALAAHYLEHAAIYYRRRRRREPTREHLNIRTALASFARYAGPGATVENITRAQVIAWRDQLIADGLSRGYINQQVARLRRFVRWAVDTQDLSPHVLTELSLVRALPAHRSSAREPEPRLPANLDQVRLTLPFLPPLARRVIQLLMLTGARLSEILELTSAQVELAHPPRLVLDQHKAAHRGKHKIVPLTREAASLLSHRLRPFCPDDPLFPAPRGAARGFYSADALRAAIRRACKRAAVQVYTPHQIRHAVARLVRQRAGREAAQALLGHARPEMTDHYAPLPSEAAQHALEALQ